MVSLTLPDVVTTQRLSLPVVTPEESARMQAGERHPAFHPDYPRRDDLDALTLPATDGWGPRHIVRAFDGLVVGSIGFFGPPVDDEVEVGFGLVRDAWGHGAGTEALTGLLGVLEGITVRAAVDPGNRASVRVLAKTGFTGLRGADEDGRLVMVRPG